MRGRTSHTVQAAKSHAHRLETQEGVPGQQALTERTLDAQGRHEPDLLDPDAARLVAERHKPQP